MSEYSSSTRSGRQKIRVRVPRRKFDDYGNEIPHTHDHKSRVLLHNDGYVAPSSVFSASTSCVSVEPATTNDLTSLSLEPEKKYKETKVKLLKKRKKKNRVNIIEDEDPDADFFDDITIQRIRKREYFGREINDTTIESSTSDPIDTQSTVYTNEGDENQRTYEPPDVMPYYINDTSIEHVEKMKEKLRPYDRKKLAHYESDVDPDNDVFSELNITSISNINDEKENEKSENYYSQETENTLDILDIPDTYTQEEVIEVYNSLSTDFSTQYSRETTYDGTNQENSTSEFSVSTKKSNSSQKNVLFKQPDDVKQSSSFRRSVISQNGSNASSYLSGNQSTKSTPSKKSARSGRDDSVSYSNSKSSKKLYSTNQEYSNSGEIDLEKEERENNQFPSDAESLQRNNPGQSYTCVSELVPASFESADFIETDNANPNAKAFIEVTATTTTTESHETSDIEEEDYDEEDVFESLNDGFKFSSTLTEIDM